MNEENKNVEIDQALKEFEEKSKAEVTSYKAVKFYNETDTPKMVQWVMKYSGGALKEQKQAEYALLGFAVIIFAISMYLFFGGAQSQNNIPSTPEQRSPMEVGIQ